jgi:uncharacterized protein (DUF488 family)
MAEAGLGYAFMGDTLGGRPDDSSLYEPGQERPDYARMEQTQDYQGGIKELLRRARKEQVAIMCSEGDHYQCHRHILITQTLMDHHVHVLHIQPDGKTISGERIPKQLSLF